MRPTTTRVVALLVVAFGVSCGPRPTPPPIPEPQPAPATVRVEVFEGDPRADLKVPGALVVLDGIAGNAPRVADAAGNVEWVSVPPGPRHLWVTAPGYRPYDQHLEVAPGVGHTVSVSLTPLPRIVKGRLQARARALTYPDGSVFRWRGVTAFALVAQVAHGEVDAARAYLQWAHDAGFTLVRVLAMCSWLDLSPEAGLAALPRTLELIRAYDLYAEVVALSDTRSLIKSGDPSEGLSGFDIQNGRQRHVEDAGNSPEAKLPEQLAHEPDVLGSENLSAMNFAVVPGDMGALRRKHLEVLGAVIIPLPIDVVNDLSWQKSSTDLLLSDDDAAPHVMVRLRPVVGWRPYQDIAATLEHAAVPSPSVGSATLQSGGVVLNEPLPFPADPRDRRSAPTGATRRIANSRSNNIHDSVIAQLGEQVASVGRIVAGFDNAIIEISNEPYHSTHWHEYLKPAHVAVYRQLVPRDVLVAYGASSDDESAEYAGGDFVTVHLDRSREGYNQVRRVRELEALSATTGKPVISDEPMGFAESTTVVRADGSTYQRWTDPSLAFAFGVLSRVMEVGTTFHLEAGLQCAVPGPVQRAAAEAFIQGTRIVPDDVVLRFANARFGSGGWDQSPVERFETTRAVRVYSGLGTTSVTIALGLTGDAAIEYRLGYGPRRVLAERPSVTVWEIGR